MYNKSSKIIKVLQEKDAFDLEDIDKLCSLSNSSNSEIRGKVAALLGRVSSEKAEKTLYKLSFDKDELVKVEAIDSLAMAKMSLSIQRLKQLCFSTDTYFRFFAYQSYCDAFLNFYQFDSTKKIELLEFLRVQEKDEKDELVLSAIYKCEAICGNDKSVLKLMEMHTKAKTDENHHLITPIYNMLEELHIGTAKIKIDEEVEKFETAVFCAEYNIN